MTYRKKNNEKNLKFNRFWIENLLCKPNQKKPTTEILSWLAYILQNSEDNYSWRQARCSFIIVGSATFWIILTRDEPFFLLSSVNSFNILSVDTRKNCLRSSFLNLIFWNKILLKHSGTFDMNKTKLILDLNFFCCIAFKRNHLEGNWKIYPKMFTV